MTLLQEMRCGKNMLKELEGIYNPTLKENMDKSIASKLIGTKIKLGTGVKKNNKFSGRIT